MEAAFKGYFNCEEEALAEKLQRIKLWVFDWDGVFHSGQKDSHGHSSYSEVDSMGLNLLRFSYFLHQKRTIPFVIVTGTDNPTAVAFAERENFNGVYMGAKNKLTVLNYLCQTYGVAPHEVAFAFDDVLDINMAQQCGARFLCDHGAHPITVDYMQHHEVFDYSTYFAGGQGALREISELSITLLGNADDVLEQRIHWSKAYDEYWAERKTCHPALFSVDTGVVLPL